MKKNHICPVEKAGHLDNRFRRWFQNPQKILQPFIKKGMTAVDLGCGPGFFTVDMAKMIGRDGRIIACDLQEGMLEKLWGKIEGTEFEKRIILHKCQADKIGIAEQVDFILAFYVVHEILHQEKFFEETKSLLKTDGRFLIVEPLFHVSKKAFMRTIQKAQEAGLNADKGPKLFFSKTAILRRF